jgi:transglutaminase/protease-like cytokinesis protein 3
VDLFYIDSQKNVTDYVDQLNQALSAIKEEIGAYGDYESNYKLEVAIHDYIILNCSNITDQTDSQSPTNALSNTAYGALVNKTAYSAGYARAFKMLMNEYGLVSYVVNGKANGADHSWNLVYLDGDYYNVDVAWDDGDISYAPYLIFHPYFNISHLTIAEDHQFDDGFTVPTAFVENNYYNKNSLYISDMDFLKENITRIIIDSIKANTDYIELFTSFDESVYNGDEFKAIINNSLDQILDADTIVSTKFKKYFRIYKISDNKNIIAVQFFT